MHRQKTIFQKSLAFSVGTVCDVFGFYDGFYENTRQGGRDEDWMCVVKLTYSFHLKRKSKLIMWSPGTMVW